jgi:hypothetical protein
VRRRDQSHLISSARQQRAIIKHALGRDVPIRAALCFSGVELSLLARPYVMEGVLVTWPKTLARPLRAPGVLGESSRSARADRLAHAFPPHRR